MTTITTTGSTSRTDDLQTLVTCYERMYRIRRFEERSVELFRAGELPGFIHPSVGQEAVPVGMTFHLTAADMITSTHRGHGHILAKGASVRGMYAELYAKETGLCRGRGGSMHIIDSSVGVLGANGIVGGGIPVAVGAALAAQHAGDDRVTVCFFGDGAVNIGSFHEALNLAAVWSLPVVFVCENNQYAESTRFLDNMAIPDLRPRAAGYGMPGVVVDGNDVEACLEVGEVAVRRARDGDGPTLVQADTYRWYGHHMGDIAPYRASEEVTTWKARDPLAAVRIKIERGGPLRRQRLAKVEAAVDDEIEDAITFARSSPDADPAHVLDHIYASSSGRAGEHDYRGQSA